MAQSHDITLYNSGTAWGVKLSDQGTSILINDAIQAVTSDTVGFQLRVNDSSQAITSEIPIITKHNPGDTVLTKVGSFNLNTASASATQAITGIGFTPKIVLFWWSGIHESGSAAMTNDQNNEGFGAATSASSRWVVDTYTYVAQIASAYSYSSSGSVITLWNQLANTGKLDISSIDVDGFTLVVRSEVTLDYKISYLALGGDELKNVYLGTYTSPTSTGSFTVTGLGFEPSALILQSINGAIVEREGTSNGTYSLGLVANDGNCGANNSVVAGWSQDLSGANTSSGYSYNGESVALITSSTAIGTRETVTSFTNDGFIVNHLEGTAARIVFYAALRGGKYNVGTFSTRTDTNDIANTIGFKSSAILFASANRVLSTQDAATADNFVSIGAISGSTATSGSNSVVQAVHNFSGNDFGLADKIYYENYVYASASGVYPNTWINGLMKVKSIETTGFTAQMDSADLAENWVTYLSIGGIDAIPSLSYALTVQNTTQLQTSDNIALTQIYSLAINNATQTQTSENVALSAHYSITVQNCSQLQTAENIVLNTHYSITVQDANQVQTSVLTNWWLANGLINSANCPIVYQPTSASSYSDSKLNIVNSSTFPLSDGAYGYPAWDITNGWTFSHASASQLLTCSTDIPVTNEPLSIIVKFKVDDVNNFYTFTAIGQAGSDGLWALTVSGSETGDYVNALASSGSGGAITKASSTLGVTVGTWYVGTAVFSSDISRSAYLNGENKGTDITPVNVVEPDLFTIGSSDIGGDNPFGYLNGNISTIAFYNIALSDTQVSTLNETINGKILLTQNYALTPNNATQLQTSENVVLSAHYAITVNDATQAQTSDNLNLSAHYSLTLSDASQIQTSDNILISPPLRVNGARYFNGTSDKIDWSNIYNPVSGSLPITISAWVKFDRTNAYQNIFAIANDSGSGAAIYFANPGSVINGAIGIYITAATTGWRTGLIYTVNANTWYNLIVTWDGTITSISSHAHIYKDGVEISYDNSRNGAKPIVSTGGPWNIGGSYYAESSDLQGYIGEVAVWDRVLTAGEISQLGSRNSPISAANISNSLRFLVHPDEPSELITNGSTTLHGTALDYGPDLRFPNYSLTIDNATQAQTSENIVLSAHYSLIVQDTIHAQTSDNVTVTYNSGTVTLTVQNAIQLQTSENVVLSAHYAIVANNATQLQTAENIVLIQHQLLTVNDATQIQKADGATCTDSTILDNFNRADGNPGTNWTIISGIPTISSNRIQGDNVSLDKFFWNVDSFSNDQYAEAKQYVPNSSGVSWRGVVVRASGSVPENYYGYVAYLDGTNSSPNTRWLRIGWHIGTTGWGQYLDSAGVAVVCEEGSILRLEVTGQSPNIVLKAYINGSLVKTLTQAQFANSLAILNSGKAGLYIHSNTPTAQMDDFAAGNLNIVNLSAHYSLTVNDAIQAQTSENIALSAHYTLTLNNATQTQTSDNIVLSAHYTTVVQDATQLQTSDKIVLIVPVGKIVDIDNETTDLSQYSSTSGSNISVTSLAGLAGTGYGLNVVVEGTTAIYAQKTFVLTTSSIRTRVYIDPNTSTMATGDKFYLVRILNSAIDEIGMVAIGKLSGGYYISGAARNDAATEISKDTNVITDLPHYIEFQITKASNAISADGTLRVWVDDIEIGTPSTNIDNYDVFTNVDRIRLGAYGVDIGTSGTFYIDELIIRDDGQYIGPNIYTPVNNTTQLQTSENVILSAHYSLTINDATQLQTSENVSLSAHYSLTVQDATQLQTSENVALTQHQVLTVNNATQVQSVDNVVLNAHYSLTVQDATQLQTADNVALSSHYTITVNNTAHTQTSENVSLSAHYAIIVQDATQLQTSENVSLSAHYTIALQDATQLQTSENVSLTQHQVLTINDVTQVQTSENVDLVQHAIGLLVTQNAAQAQTSGSVALETIAVRENGSRLFNGTTDRIDWTNKGDLSGQPITISAWINPKVLAASNDYIFAIHNAGNTSWGLVFNITSSTDGSPVMDFVKLGGSQYYWEKSGGLIHSDRWYNVIVTNLGGLSASSTTFYLDSVNYAPSLYSPGTGTETAHTGSYSVGGRIYDNTRNFEGKIGEVAVWNRILTSDEIKLVSTGSSLSSGTWLRDGLIFVVHPDEPKDMISNDTGILTGTSLTYGPDLAMGMWRLEPQNATQLQSAENVALTAHYTLTVNNTSHLQTSDNIIVKAHPNAFFMLQQTGFYLLQENGDRIVLQAEGVEVKNATQSQTADNVSLTQHQVLTMNNATQLQTAEAITLLAHYSLIVNNATQLQTSDNISLSAYYTITVQDATQLQTSDKIDLVQHSYGVLNVQNSTQLQTSDNISLTQHQILTINDATQLQVSDNIVLTGKFTITVNDASQAQYTFEVSAIANDYILTRQYFGVYGIPTLYFPLELSRELNLIYHSPTGALVVQNATQLQNADNVNLSAHYAIVVQDATQLQTAENVNLSAHYTIAVQDATQIQLSENINLLAHYSVVTNDATHLQTAENISLNAHYAITTNNATHLQTSDNITLSAHYAITVQDATQLQTSENISLSAHYAITVQDATQLQTSENIALVQHQILTINDAIQLQTAENIGLTQHQVLTINNATQSQTSDNVSLTQHQVLTVNDSTQLQTAENINLSAHYAISVNNATQIQTAENVVLNAHYTTTINDAIQLQTSETVTLTQHHVLSINNATQIQTSETVDLVQHQIGLLVIDNAIQPQTSDTITLTTIPPNFILAADYVLSNGGLSTVNGYYNNSGTLNGKIYWKLSTDSDIRIWWNGAIWVIGKYSTSTTYYYSTDDVRLPELATSWIVFIPGGGIAPTPTIFSKMNAVQAQTAENATVIPLFSLVVKDATQLQTSDNVNLTAHYTLTVNDTTHLQISDNVNLSAHYSIAVQNATHLQTSENVILSAHYSITVQDTIHLQTSDNVSLTGTVVLTTNNATQLQTSDNVNLSAHYAITINNATQLQNADNVDLNQKLLNTLSVQNSTQLQTADNIDLTQHQILTVNNATQAQTSDNVNLSAHYTLTVNDTVHLQTAEEINLTYHNVLVVEDCTHNQTADNITLTQNYLLLVNNTVHLQTSDTINLAQNYILVSNDATQLQNADNVTLTAHAQTFALVLQDAIQNQTAENVVLLTRIIIFLTAYMLTSIQGTSILKRTVDKPSFTLTNIKGDSHLKREFEDDSYVQESVQGTTFAYNKKI